MPAPVKVSAVAVDFAFPKAFQGATNRNRWPQNLARPFQQATPTEIPGSDELVLCQGDGNGGGYYEMKTFRQIPVDHELWLCELLQLLFGTLPDRLYIRQQAAN